MWADQSFHFYGQVQQPIGLNFPATPSPFSHLPPLATAFKNTSSGTANRGSTTPGRCSLSYRADDPFSLWNPFDQSRFDLTVCFKYSLYLLPFLVILINGSVDLYKLSARPVIQPKSSNRTLIRLSQLTYISKLLLIIVVSIFQLAYSAILFVRSGWWDPVECLSNLVICASLLFAIPLHHLSHQRSQRSSTSLLFFHLFFLVTSAIELRSHLDHSLLHQHPHQTGFLILRSLLITTVFVLECLGPFKYDDHTYSFGEDGYAALPQDEATGAGSDQADRRSESPLIYANVFSRLTFGWMTPMMKLGKSQYLTEDDLWMLPREDQTDSLTNRLHQTWRRQLSRAPSSPSLIRAIAQAYGGPYLLAALFKLIQDMLQFTQPQLLRRLLSFADSFSPGNEPEPVYRGYMIAALMFSCGLIQTLFLHQYFDRVFVTGIRVRSGLIGVIYQKSLVLSNEEKSGRATGDIVNLMSTDVSRIQDSCSNGLILVSGLFQITLAFISLYDMLGWPMLGGIAVVLLSIPLNIGLARLQSRLQKLQMKNKDSRTRLMNEILNNIRSIKLYTWENAFTQKLFAIRNERELGILRKIGYLSSASISLWNFIPFLVAFSAFSIFSLVGDSPLTPALVFPAISLFQLLQFPLAVLPMVINQWVEAYVSANRICNFLTSKELQQDAVIRSEHTTEAQGLPVEVKDANFTWSSGADATLSDISLSVPQGDLLAVVGRVGSGKSSLLSGILGEMYKLSGKVQLRGKVAYAAQTPWLLSATLKENILFGAEYDKELYDSVIAGCALVDDLAMLKDGDETQVGEKGIALSGGQKARISLARTVYARADVYLLDDPLSSVDAHVARHLFDKVIGPTGLLRNKARILCTNAIPFCQQADELIMVRDGKIVERGTFQSVLANQGDLRKLIDEFGKNTSQDDISDDLKPSDSTIAVSENSSKSSASKPRQESVALMRRPLITTSKNNQMPILKTRKAPGKVSEHKEKGSVKYDVYKTYLRANGVFGVGIALGSVVVQQILSLATTIWLKNWSSSNQTHSDDDGPHLGYYLGIYGLLGFLTSVTAFVNGVTLFSICAVRSAKVLHDQMFAKVLRAPMSFFDTTPVGTILNRFSRDVFVIDEVLARVFSGFLRTSAGVVSVVAVVSWAVPPFLLVCIPLLLIYKGIQSYYLATSREIKRIDAITKSPIFAMFAETLTGVATIRAFGEQGRFVVENETKVDRNQEACFASIGANRWLAVRLELIGNVMILTAASLAVTSLAASKPLDSGMVGVLMSYALSITQSLNWLVRSATEVETNIVSCERVVEYTKLKQEGPWETDEHHRPSPSWPEKGEIVYEGVECRYRDGLDLVLKGVDFKVQAQEKIGICGRTGAGKSTITLSLFRLIEKAGGRILIDGVDISQIGLNDLRSKVSIIPQDSQCFEGSLRANLDPEGLKTDEELWKVLEHSKLKAHIQSLEGGLDARIEEGGNNLSNGQRQLLCLARAMLLKSSKILVMDEATSSVDPETDADIQAVIRNEFKSYTILVIAHRLNTILDCDKILVINKGKVVEFDSPDNLMKNKESEFCKMCQEAGLIN
ncbi:hypothetical protein PtA15_8A14 [Puccinia triticina]|uniref:Metal resistance protein ycf1 n=1 Tax=Puccinia triticina TaxID=208348 RepID=A0ABY7CPD3_9BASI|nr:uncharacterized protein PtA15_8A14 [Puccinia triticina]WAQ87113.1 hypothetical protein PtA15_8A14 [Puccinia triticina]WAR56972.1 hypothetical protein PtB15_8B16 [Puccinia triticina]